jgi:hypothetical protein
LWIIMKMFDGKVITQTIVSLIFQIPNR